MKLKAIIKLSVDVAMYVVFLLLMGQCVLRDSVHEWLGISAGVLFLIHNALNYKWYLTLMKGKYNIIRRIQLAIDIFLLLVMMGCMFSGILISQHIFVIGGGSTIELGRCLHLVTTAWGFILISLHVGLHWSFVVGMVKNINAGEKTKRIFRIIFHGLVIVLCIYGMYLFAERQFWEELFHLIDYQKEYDYAKSVVAYFAESTVLSVPFIAAAYYVKKLLSVKGERKSENEKA